jgi:hypothetical protein
VKTRVALMGVLTAAQGCTCGKTAQVDEHTASSSYSSAPAATPSSSAAPEGPTRVLGTWNGRPFRARSALAEIHERWIDVTLIDRDAACTQRKLQESDMALQITVPTGPSNDFFVGHPLAIPVKLSGAGGVSAVPPAHASATLENVDRNDKGVVKGRVQFSWRTGREEDAPAYDVSGSFEAVVCGAKPTTASMPALDIAHKNVTGKVSGRQRTFPSFLAFVQKTSDGRQLFQLKGFTTKNVSCYSEKPNTPYLFGPEMGPGPDGKYFAGGWMPADWVMQMVDNKFSERSVHAGEGTGAVQIQEANLSKNGVVRGQMMATTVSEDDEEWSFEIAGSFEAAVCELPIGQIAP